MIISKQLTVNNKKKNVIEEELRELKFKPFPKNNKKAIKVAGETEDTLEDEDADAGQAGDYDYLLGMAIWSLTAEKVRLRSTLPGGRLISQVEKLLSERDGKEAELLELLKLSSQDIWNHDLDNFMAEWQVSQLSVSVVEADWGARSR